MKKVWILAAVFVLGLVLIPTSTEATRQTYCILGTKGDDITDDISDDLCQESATNAPTLVKYMKVTAPDIMSQTIGRFGDTASPTFTITWDSPTLVKFVNILYSLDNGKTYTEIAAGIPNDGTYQWTLPEINTTTAKIRVSGRGADGYNYGSDLSNAFFTIKNAG